MHTILGTESSEPFLVLSLPMGGGIEEPHGEAPASTAKESRTLVIISRSGERVSEGYKVFEGRDR